MKKQTLKLQTTLKNFVILTLIMLMTGNVLAQKNVFKVSPFPLQSKFTLSYERTLNENSSLVFGYQKWFIKSNDYAGLAAISWSEWFDIFSESEVYTNDGYRLNGAFRKYFSSKEEWCSGFYGEVNVFGGIHEITYQNTYQTFGILSSSETRIVTGEDEVKVLGGGLTVGYQKKIKQFTVDVSALLGKSEVLDSDGLSTQTIGNDSGYTANAIKPFKNDMQGEFVKLNFSIGMAF